MAVSEENVDLAFDCFDVDHNGVLSVKEFREKLGKNVSSEQYQKLVQSFDKNGDGFIDR